MPPELNAPTHANLSRLFRPVSRDSDPPIERPAIARELRSLVTRYSLSIFGMTSVSSASRKFEKFLSRTSVWLHAPHPLASSLYPCSRYSTGYVFFEVGS